jgi:hypothetical protein
MPDAPSSQPSTTTKEEDRHSLGQRRVNLIWEGTQAAVALIITVALIYCVISEIAPGPLGDAFTLIVALYYVRTNHTKVGGVVGPEHR